MIILLIVGLIKRTLQKMSKYFPKPCEPFGGDIKKILFFFVFSLAKTNSNTFLQSMLTEAISMQDKQCQVNLHSIDTAKKNATFYRVASTKMS